ncbi:MGDG synthase family glycosyltransferase [Brevibacillus sp. TJ4]|uniref:MGDG synthase family glycosyltransferase n=1 Tax=Brevibacillus sp. TJ4 TaxID=3234853 RepID=UPI0037CCD257
MARRFLLVTEEWAGSGHRMAAIAIQEALREKQEVESARLVGGLQTASPALREVSRIFYANMLRYGQPIWQRIYQQDKIWSTTLKKPVGKWLSSRLVDTLLEEKPEVVVATHAYCLSALAEAKRQIGQTFHLVSVPTDFYVNHFWVHPAVDTYIVAHQQVADQLHSAYRIHPERIRVHGIPVRRPFSMASHAAKAHWKQTLGLSPDLFTVLIAGGEGGYGNMESVVTELMKSTEAMQIVVVTGKNEALLQRLRAVWEQNMTPHRLYIRGYEPELWRWLGAADVYVTKPGGISCAEALSMRTPMILYQPLPGQEQHNTAFLLRHGVAALAEQPQMILGAVQQMSRHEEWEKAIKRMEMLRKPASSEQTAEYLLRL